MAVIRDFLPQRECPRLATFDFRRVIILKTEHLGTKTSLWLLLNSRRAQYLELNLASIRVRQKV
jgi:hypothetical protein